MDDWDTPDPARGVWPPAGTDLSERWGDRARQSLLMPLLPPANPAQRPHSAGSGEGWPPTEAAVAEEMGGLTPKKPPHAARRGGHPWADA